MQNKKAITLSVNFLVVIILALVILGFSVYFLYSVIGRAKTLGDITQENLNKKIETLQCDGTVCLSVNYKKIERGKFDIFGINVYNDGSAGNFTIVVNPIENQTDVIYYMPKEITFKLRTNEEKRIGIGFEPQKNASSDIYIFNVNVSRDNIIYGTPRQIRVEVS